MTKNFELEDWQVPELVVACEALDRAASCRETIEAEGATITDRFGQPKPHPLLAAERDARSLFLRAAKQLGLDVEPAGPVGRPPGR